MPDTTTIDLPELRRLRSLDQLDALGFVGDPVLERITRLATVVAETAGAGIHVHDAETQHRLAGVGAPLDRWPRSDTLCNLTVETRRPVVSLDAVDDARFAGSSFVTGDQPVRFYAAVPLRTPSDDVLGTLCVWDTAPHTDTQHVEDALTDLAAMVVDHFEMSRLVRIYADLAMTDPLTGLPNRRMLLDNLEREVARREREGGEITVTVVDLDGFKQVNDEHGHDVGDVVLEAVGQRLRSVIRGDELCARLGGDEFVLVQHTSVPDSGAAIDRMLETISEPIPTPVGDLAIGASAGSAGVRSGDRADTVIRRADTEMYAAKRTNRPA